MFVRSKPFSCFLAFTIYITATFDVVGAPSATCKSMDLCPLPNGVTSSGLENGNVLPWPQVKDTGTEEHCLPPGKDYMKFTCDNGFRLQAEEIHLACDHLYNWNLDAPVCVPDEPPPPPGPPSKECTGSVCEASEQDDAFTSDAGSDADEGLVIVIIVLSVLLVISWLMFLFVFICRREEPIVHTLQETVYVREELKPNNMVEDQNINLQPSKRPPMPKPRDDIIEEPVPEYDYIERDKYHGDGDKPEYLELEKE